MFFENWTSLLRILIVGTSSYVILILFIRMFGKRTLAKMSAFDLIVTVALGSTLATVMISKDVKLADGVLALFLLCGLQFVIAYASVRSRRVERAVKAEPALLYFQGRFLDDTMQAELVTVDEILAAVRSQGINDLGEVGAAVLEADGSISVMRGPPGKQSVLLQGGERAAP